MKTGFFQSIYFALICMFGKEYEYFFFNKDNIVGKDEMDLE